MPDNEMDEIRAPFGEETMIPKEAAETLAAHIVERARTHSVGSFTSITCPSPDNDIPGGLIAFEVRTSRGSARFSAKMTGAKHQSYAFHGRSTCTIRGDDGDVSRVAAALRRASNDPIEHARRNYARVERVRIERERRAREAEDDETSPF